MKATKHQVQVDGEHYDCYADKCCNYCFVVSKSNIALIEFPAKILKVFQKTQEAIEVLENTSEKEIQPLVDKILELHSGGAEG